MAVPTELLNCLNAGACVAVKTWQFYAFMGIFGLCGLLFVAIFLLRFWTPAFVFLKAKMKRSPIILLVNRSQQGRFVVGKVEGEGLCSVKKVGKIILSENSHIIEKVSHVPLFVSHGEFAPTMTLDYAYVIMRLREQGVKLDNWDDIDNIVRGWVEKFSKENLKRLRVAGKINEVEFAKRVEQRHKFENFRAVIRPYKSIRFHDLAYMFPFNITPAMIESHTQYKLAMKQQFWNKWLNLQTAVIIIVVLMGIALVGFIAWKLFTGQGDSTQTIRIVTDAIQAGGVESVQNLTLSG